MFDESKAPYFKDLPVWLQKDILQQRNHSLEWERVHEQEREVEIERKCARRGYELFPTRGEMAYPPTRRSRRPVGDFSILDED